MKLFKWFGFGRCTVLAITGGSLTGDHGGTTFYGEDGVVVFFPGVRIATRFVVRRAAYQMSGVIYISRSWAADGFNLKIFAHEYGHYLQQRQWGTFYYLVRVAIPSLFSAWLTPAKHHLRWFEQDATARGNLFLGTPAGPVAGRG